MSWLERVGKASKRSSRYFIVFNERLYVGVSKPDFI